MAGVRCSLDVINPIDTIVLGREAAMLPSTPRSLPRTDANSRVSLPRSRAEVSSEGRGWVRGREEKIGGSDVGEIVRGRSRGREEKMAGSEVGEMTRGEEEEGEEDSVGEEEGAFTRAAALDDDDDDDNDGGGVLTTFCEEDDEADDEVFDGESGVIDAIVDLVGGFIEIKYDRS